MLPSERLAEIRKQLESFQQAKARAQLGPWKRNCSQMTTAGGVDIAQFGDLGFTSPQDMHNLEFCATAYNSCIDDCLSEVLKDNEVLRENRGDDKAAKALREENKTLREEIAKLQEELTKPATTPAAAPAPVVAAASPASAPAATAAPTAPQKAGSRR